MLRAEFGEKGKGKNQCPLSSKQIHILKKINARVIGNCCEVIRAQLCDLEDCFDQLIFFCVQVEGFQFSFVV
jgi:hypothetical protein